MCPYVCPYVSLCLPTCPYVSLCVSIGVPYVYPYVSLSMCVSMCPYVALGVPMWSAHNYSFVVGQHKAAEQLTNKMEKVRPHFIGPCQLLSVTGLNYEIAAGGAIFLPPSTLLLSQSYEHS